MASFFLSQIFVFGQREEAHSSFRALAASISPTPTDVLQVLAEMSWDTLLLLVGLAFVAVAVVGNISGKISPGKEGRIAAAILGGCLVAGGIWYHMTMHRFRVSDIAVVSPGPQSGPCPITIKLQGYADGVNSGDLIYQFEFSNGNASELNTVTFQQTGSQILTGSWIAHESIPNAWVKLSVASPKKMVTKSSRNFSIKCGPTTAGGTEAPAVEPQGAAAAPATPPAAGGSSTPIPAAVPVSAPVVDERVDGVVLNSVSPKAGTYLNRGKPLTFTVHLTYNLVSADSAILSLSTAENRSADCGGGGELSDAAQIPIQRGTHQATLQLTWSGDTGLATKGRIYGNGSISFVPMFWASVNGQRGQRIAFFGSPSEYCYRFGP
jgi:hypothetical protein